MDGQSLTPQAIKQQALRQLFPQAFHEDRLDWAKLQAALGKEILLREEEGRYALGWAGKERARAQLQQPTSATLNPCREASVDFDTTNHLLIEGENLAALKVLQRSYYEQVKMIYIDPPYNTGNDTFVYDDRFAERKESYQQKTGQRNAQGALNWEEALTKHSKEHGHYHSRWLSMIYPRLSLARNLLREDGVIFISIDDHEVHNLRLVMDELFGEENFVGDGIRKTKSTTNDAKTGFNIQHEHFLVYAKDIGKIELVGEKKDLGNYTNPDNDPHGPWVSSDPSAKSGSPSLYYPITNPYTKKVDYPPNGRFWAFPQSSLEKWVKQGKVKFKQAHNPNERGFLLKRYREELGRDTHLVDSLFATSNSYMNQVATKEINTLFEDRYFDYPKPTIFVQKLVACATHDTDLILDFFAGSGTTAHAVMALNQEDGGQRRCISVQLPEPCDPKSAAHQAGYKTIADIAKERIRRAGAKIKEAHPHYQGDLGFKVFKLAPSNFATWRLQGKHDAQTLTEQLQLFTDKTHPTASREAIRYELMLKSGLPLTTPMEHVHGYYRLHHQGATTVLLLDTLPPNFLDHLLASDPLPTRVIVLDSAFAGQDQAKTDLAAKLKQAQIPFLSR